MAPAGSLALARLSAGAGLEASCKPTTPAGIKSFFTWSIWNTCSFALLSQPTADHPVGSRALRKSVLGMLGLRDPQNPARLLRPGCRNQVPVEQRALSTGAKIRRPMRPHPCWELGSSGPGLGPQHLATDKGNMFIWAPGKAMEGKSWERQQGESRYRSSLRYLTEYTVQIQSVPFLVCGTSDVAANSARKPPPPSRRLRKVEPHLLPITWILLSDPQAQRRKACIGR